MPRFGGPYYQRRALTGYPGEMPSVGYPKPSPSAIPQELGERYGEMAGPREEETMGQIASIRPQGGQAIMTTGQADPSRETQWDPNAMTMAEDPEAGRKLAYHLGGPFVSAPPGTPTLKQPYSTVAKAGQYAATTAKTGLPLVGWFTTMFERNILAPLIVEALPALGKALGLTDRGYPSPTPTPTFDVDWEPRQGIPGFDPTRDVDREERQGIPGFDPTRDVDWEARQGIPGFDYNFNAPGYDVGQPTDFGRGFSEEQYGMIDWGATDDDTEGTSTGW